MPALFARKLLLPTVLLLLPAGAAYAQTGPFYCTTSGGTPAFVRAEGVAELVNDFVLDCSGGAAQSGRVANFTFFFNTAVTSRILSYSTAEPLLIIDDLAQPAAVGVNLYAGSVSGNQIQFVGVQFSIPGGAQNLRFRLTNVRVNAAALAGSPSTDGTPPQVQAIVSISGTTSVPINNPTQIVGVVVPGMSMELRTAADTPAASVTFPSGGMNPGMPGNQTGVSMSHKLVFTEGFPTSFLKRNAATTAGAPAALANQNTPATAHSTETGWYDGGYPSANGLNLAGLATQGTRLMARFTNIPAGVSLYVTTRPLQDGTAGPPRAVLISVDPTGAGAYAAAAQTGTTSEGYGISPLNVINGSAAAVWEVMDSSAAVDQMTFGVVLSYAGSPAGAAAVSGTLGPLSSVAQADLNAPVPRFTDSALLPSACAGPDCILVTPAALTFSYQTGGVAPGPAALQVSSPGGPVAVTATANGSGWLLVTPSAVTPGTLSVSVNPQWLTPGVYSGIVTVSRQSPALSRTVFVSLTVTAGAPDTIPMSCVANAAVPPTVRSEGNAELMGDLVFVCTGGPAGVARNLNVQIALNVPVTSRILSGGGSEALLLVNEPNQWPSYAAPVMGVNAFQGSVVSPNTVLFSNVPVTQPGVAGSPLVLRITNLRADARQAPDAPPPYSVASITAVSTIGGVTVFNPTQLLAFAQPGLAFSLLNMSDQPAAGMAFVSPSTSPALVNKVRFRENFSTAFRRRNIATSATAPTALADQSSSGAIYNTESGFYVSSFPSVSGLNTAGLATQGTRLTARFTGVPPGVTLYVTVGPIPNGPVSGNAARLIAADGRGNGAWVPVPAAMDVNWNNVMTGFAPIPVSGGVATATWEVVAESPLAVETFEFLVLTSYPTAQTGQAWVNGSLSPLSSAGAPDSTSPVPRFGLGAEAAALLESPSPGFALPGASVSFQWMKAPAATQYRLTVGDSPGATEYWASSTTGTSLTVSGLPFDGRTVHARLATEINGQWRNEDYTFPAWNNGSYAPAGLLSPAAGSTLTATSLQFQWSAGSGVSSYQLSISRLPGGAELFNQATGPATSAAVSGLPADDSTLYVRVWSLIQGHWQFRDYTVAACNACSHKAVLLSPAPSSTAPYPILPASATFQWTPGAGAAYQLSLGRVQGGAEFYNQYLGSALSATVSNLPSDGLPVYVRLWTLISGAWQFNDYTFFACVGCDVVKASMASPSPGMTLGAGPQQFQWLPGLGITIYQLSLSRVPGGGELFNQSAGTNTSIIVPALPRNGGPVYARLWSYAPSTAWQFNDYTYTACNGCGVTKAAILSPTPGATLGASPSTFQWSAGSGVAACQLSISSVSGGAELFNQYMGAALSVQVSGLPSDGRTLYIRLWSLISGAWQFNDYTYTAAAGGSAKGVLVSPAPGSTLNGSPTFQWTAGSQAAAYQLSISSVSGGAELFNQYMGAALSVQATGLPSDGRTLYVRLWSLISGAWQFNDYTYTAAAGGSAKGVLVSPAPGSTLNGSVSFQWTAGSQAAAYQLSISSVWGGAELFNQYMGAALSVQATGLPTDGRTLYVRLWSLISGAWQFNSYTYTASAVTKAAMVAPVPFTTLGSRGPTFTWTPGNAAAYQLSISSVAGQAELYNQYLGGSLAATPSGLPNDGRTLYVRLWSLHQGQWHFTDYTYTACLGCP